MVSLVAIILAVLFCLCNAADEDSQARLLSHKQILNRFLVEGKDIVVDYNIYNVGGSAALDIHLTENNFPEENFELVSGLLKLELDRLGPGTNVSHTVVVRPKTFGYFNFTAAEISYLPSDESKEPQVSFTTEPGEGGIVALRDFDRKFSPHMLDWAAFAVMTLPSLGIPFLLWISSKSKYEAILKQTKKH